MSSKNKKNVRGNKLVAGLVENTASINKSGNDLSNSGNSVLKHFCHEMRERESE